MSTEAMPPAGWAFETLANRAVFGAGSALTAAEELKRLGASRVMLIASKGAATRNPALVTALGDLVVAHYDGIEAHCPIETVEAGEALYRQSGADGLVTLGGGSALGVAKNLSLRLGAASLAIPTTYCGSEMTMIVGAKHGGEKRTERHPKAKPGAVIYDPLVTLSLPAEETATTGMNGLAHCIEAFYPATPAPFAAQIAADGTRAFFEGLPASVARPDDVAGRTRAQQGGFAGGLLVQLVGIGVHHRICHVLGGRFDVAHGVSNSVILPHVAAFNAAAITAAAPALFEGLGGSPGAAIQGLARRIGAPTELKSCGIPREALGAVAAETLRGLRFNPRPLSLAELEQLLIDAWEGKAT
jgi:maleylacetate reductase